MSHKQDNLLKKYPTRLPRCIWYRHKDKIRLCYCPSRKRTHLLTLKGIKADLWLRLDGKKSIKQINKGLGNDVAKKELIQAIQYLLNKGLLTLRDKPIKELKAKDKKALYYFNIAQSIRHEVFSSKFLKKKERDTTQYHIHKIKNPYHQFNRIERTVSHNFSKTHPVLGASYGVRLREELERRKPFSKGVNILEVGGGIGWVARRLLDDLRKSKPSVYKELRYAFLDLSPSLLRSQRRLNRSHKNASFLRGHAEHLPFKDKSFDYLIANEIIADFRVTKLKKDLVFSKSKGSQKEALQMIQKYQINLDDAPRSFIFTIGVVRFLEEIERILKSGGLAIIIEYGSDWSYPKSVRLKGHKEHSIHFGHLRWVAGRLGLNIEMSDLLRFLRFRRQLKVIKRCSRCLLWKLTKKPKQLLNSYITQSMLKKSLNKDYKKFRNIQFANFNDYDGILKPQGFKVMVLRKMK